MIAIDRPELTFDMFRADARGMRLADSETDRFFGSENKREFKATAKRGQPIPEETRQRVDREVYDRVGKMLGIGGGLPEWEASWKKAMKEAIATHNYARGILFADQDRQGTLTTNIDWDDWRPSTALERLTMPSRRIGAQCKYEQGRQLGLAMLCAEVMSRDENGHARAILTALNNALEENPFVGKSGDPQPYRTYSYHVPDTNRLVDVSSDYPHPHLNLGNGLSVKKLDFPVRTIRTEDAGIPRDIPVLYEPRDKNIASAVIKAKERSLLATKLQKGRVIETTPYATDQLGVQFVVMQGRAARDQVTARLEQLFDGFEATKNIEPDDQVDISHGSPGRIEFRRRLLYMEGLNNPIELIVYALEDWIPSEYEVGTFSEALGMHDGRAHDLYKLKVVGNIAEFMWPFKVFGIDLEDAKKVSSFDYAARLRRKQRIHPSPYLEES